MLLHLTWIDQPNEHSLYRGLYQNLYPTLSRLSKSSEMDIYLRTIQTQASLSLTHTFCKVYLHVLIPVGFMDYIRKNLCQTCWCNMVITRSYRSVTRLTTLEFIQTGQADVSVYPKFEYILQFCDASQASFGSDYIWIALSDKLGYLITFTTSWCSSGILIGVGGRLLWI